MMSGEPTRSTPNVETIREFARLNHSGVHSCAGVCLARVVEAFAEAAAAPPEPPRADWWDVRPATLARMFHEEYEALAPDYGYETRPESAVAWDDVPGRNQRLMVATAEAVQRRLRAAAPLEPPLGACPHGLVPKNCWECRSAAPVGLPDPERLAEAASEMLLHIDTYDDAMGHSYCDTQAGEGWPCSCGFEEKRDRWASAIKEWSGVSPSATEQESTDEQ